MSLWVWRVYTGKTGACDEHRIVVASTEQGAIEITQIADGIPAASVRLEWNRRAERLCEAAPGEFEAELYSG